jgi:ribonuclease-3
METKIKVKKAQDIIGYEFRDDALLRVALTHASMTQGEGEDNERMEFLGDAILNVILSEILYHAFPQKNEGGLTLMKSFLVSRSTLARVARGISLRECFLLGKGISRRKELPDSVLANVFEAVLAAIYLDGGFAPARDFIHRTLSPEVDNIANTANHFNYKSMLQDNALRLFGVSPEYRVLEEVGPDHGKDFRVQAVINGRPYAQAWGKTKKEAQQRAAEASLILLEEEKNSL